MKLDILTHENLVLYQPSQNGLQTVPQLVVLLHFANHTRDIQLYVEPQLQEMNYTRAEMISDVSANWCGSAGYTANMSGLLRTMNWFRSLVVHVQSRSDICN